MMPSWQAVVLGALVGAVVGGGAWWFGVGLGWSLLVLNGLALVALVIAILKVRRRAVELDAGGDVGAAPRFVTQDEYAAILNRDRERMAGTLTGTGLRFVWSAAAGTWECACHRKAELVSVFHPIWDGPFDEGGSGVVDRRDIPWCLSCEGAPPSMNGQPIRLPYLDQLPVRLRWELFERAAFHRLPVQVELFRPPAP